MKTHLNIPKLIVIFVLSVVSDAFADTSDFFRNKTVQLHYVLITSICDSNGDYCNSLPKEEIEGNIYVSSDGSIFDYAKNKTGVRYRSGEWIDDKNLIRSSSMEEVTGDTLAIYYKSDTWSSTHAIVARGSACTATYKSEFVKSDSIVRNNFRVMFCRIVPGHIER